MASTTSQNTQQNPFKNKHLTHTRKTCALFFDATFSQHAGFDVQQLAEPDSPRSPGLWYAKVYNFDETS